MTLMTENNNNINNSITKEDSSSIQMLLKNNQTVITTDSIEFDNSLEYQQSKMINNITDLKDSLNHWRNKDGKRQYLQS